METSDYVRAVVDRAPDFTDLQGAGLRRIFGIPAWPGDDEILEGEALRAVDNEGDGPRAGVYFVKCGTHIKIGISNDVVTRMAGFRTSNPEPCILVGFIHSPFPGRRRKLETRLHGKWAAIRKPGTEWFQITPDLLRWINAERQAGVIK